MDVMDLVSKENRPGDIPIYVGDPGEIYPATVDHIRDTVVDNGSFSPLDYPLRIAREYERVVEVPAEAWDLALTEYGSLTKKKEQQLHDHALEVARRVFTAHLRTQLGGGIGLHLARNEHYRLYDQSISIVG